MPCSKEHMTKLDSMLDELFAPKKDAAVTMDPSKNEDCKPFSDRENPERNELRTGALSKQE